MADADRALRQKYGLPRFNVRSSGNAVRQIWTKRGPANKPVRQRRADSIAKCVPEASRLFATSGGGDFTMDEVEMYRLMQSLRAAENERRARDSFLGKKGGKSANSDLEKLRAISSGRWRDVSGKQEPENKPKLFNNWRSKGCGRILTVSISQGWLHMVLLDTGAMLKARQIVQKPMAVPMLKVPKKTNLKL